RHWTRMGLGAHGSARVAAGVDEDRFARRPEPCARPRSGRGAVLRAIRSVVVLKGGSSAARRYSVRSAFVLSAMTPRGAQRRTPDASRRNVHSDDFATGAE